MPKTRKSAAIVSATGFCAWLLPAISIAQAELPASDAPTGVLDEIVVVAHKHERSIRNVAATVTVLSQDELAANLATSLTDIFRYSPGIDYEGSGTRFNAEGISIRGIGGNRVAVLVDGVPMSDQFDVGSFSNATRDFINTGFVRRIEVLHGPASALYGSSAIGGVVAVTTPDPSDLLDRGYHGGDLLATWRGEDLSLHGSAMLAFGRGDRGFLVGASQGDGQERQSAAVEQPLDFRDYRRRSLLAKYTDDEVPGGDIELTFIHQDSDVRSDLNSMLGSGRYRSTTALEGDDRYDMDLAVAQYGFGRPDGWVDTGVLRAYYEVASTEQQTLDERAVAQVPVSIDRFFGFEQRIRGAELNLQKTLSGDRIDQQLGFGVEYRRRDTEEYRDGLSTNLDDGTQTNVLLGEVFPLRDFPVSESTEWGAYLEDVVSIGDWSLIAALRADRYELRPKTDAMYLEDYPFASPVSLSDADVSPKLGLVYHAGDATDVYLQYAHGFRAPPYEDANISLEVPLFNYRAVPNPELESERSRGVEAGLRWQGQAAQLRLGIFHSRYEDFIESKVRIGTDPASGRILFQSQNLSHATIEGVEGGWAISRDSASGEFSTDGSFYVARGENGDNGEPLNSVGPAQLVLGGGWQSESGRRQLRLQATLTEAWSSRDESGGELFEPPGYAVVDLFFTQRLGERLALRAAVTNLTDRVWWHWSDVRGLAPDDPVIPYLAQSGRSVGLSLNLVW